MGQNAGNTLYSCHCSYLEKWLHLLFLFPLFSGFVNVISGLSLTKVWSQSFVHLELRKHLSFSMAASTCNYRQYPCAQCWKNQDSIPICVSKNKLDYCTKMVRLGQVSWLVGQSPILAVARKRSGIDRGRNWNILWAAFPLIFLYCSSPLYFPCTWFSDDVGCPKTIIISP